MRVRYGELNEAEKAEFAAYARDDTLMVTKRVILQDERLIQKYYAVRTPRRRGHPWPGWADAEERPLGVGHGCPPRAALGCLVDLPHDHRAEGFQSLHLDLRVVDPQVQVHGGLAESHRVDFLDDQLSGRVSLLGGPSAM